MSETIKTKQCSKCKKIKALSEFHRDKQRKQGRRPECKLCAQAYGRSYNKTDSAKASVLKYRKTEKGKLAMLKYFCSDARKITSRAATNKYYYSHPQKSKAKAAVNYAIKIGETPHLTNLLCSYDKQAQQYHHPSYAKKHWLDVIPVCIPCHVILHKVTA